MRPLMPTPLTKAILNLWTPLRAEFGRWVSNGSVDAGTARVDARLEALPPEQKSDQAAA